MQPKPKLESLLNQVKKINQKYDQIAAKTGENFNIFRILNLSTNEVKLHSSLLAEFLNPDGSHGMKDTFLKLFLLRLAQLDKTVNTGYTQTEKAKIKVEKWIGNIDKEKYTGGFIDIYIQIPGRKNIIIENKIYATDQDGQLRRYHHFDKTAELLYLTLDGTVANDYTTKNAMYPANQITPTPISYKNEIKEWLEDCKKEAIDYPFIRETLSQYIYLIKHLTNQTMNNNKERELVELITNNSSYIESAQEIEGVWKKCKFQILQNLEEDIFSIAEEFGFQKEGKIDPELGKQDSYFEFYKKGWPVSIYFYFKSELDEIIVGVDSPSKKNDGNNVMTPEIQENLVSQLNHEIDLRLSIGGSWIWVVKFEELNSLGWYNIKNELPNKIREKVRIISGILDRFIGK